MSGIDDRTCCLEREPGPLCGGRGREVGEKGAKVVNRGDPQFLSLLYI